MEVSLWRMGKMTRYLNMSDLLLQDHFFFSLPALPGKPKFYLAWFRQSKQKNEELLWNVF